MTENLSSRLTHFNAAGQAHMVDVSAKQPTERTAVAAGWISMSAEALELVAAGQIGKGDVLGVARLAGIMAAKRTAELIPLCHNISLSSVSVDFAIDTAQQRINIKASVKCLGKTGAEMEALTAVSVAALTIYDMCKAVDKTMVIGDIKLLRKSGGKSGVFIREESE